MPLPLELLDLDMTREEVMALPEWPKDTKTQETDVFLGECEVVTDKYNWHGYHLEVYLRPSTGERFTLYAASF